MKPVRALIFSIYRFLGQKNNNKILLNQKKPQMTAIGFKRIQTNDSLKKISIQNF